MFSSSSSPNCDNPFDSLPFTTPNFPSDLQNPNFSKQDHKSPFLFNLPSPFFDEDDLPLNQIFFQTADHRAPDDHNIVENSMKEESAKSNTNETGRPADRTEVPGIVKRRNLGVVPRRRTGKKDRHSKICTAQGIRDRRMRLSLQVARKFFDLQDLLGYDKASKTIEWLFTKSKKAIKELTKGCNPQASKGSNGYAKSEYFHSECEVVSNDIDNANISIDPAPNLSPSVCVDPNSEIKDEKKSQNKTTVRESRDKARARARCRAKEKMITKRFEEESGQGYKYKSNPNFQKLGFSNIQFDQQSNSHDQDRVSPYGSVFNSQELSDLGTIDKLLGNSSSSISSSCPLSDYFCSGSAVSGYIDPNCNSIGFPGNWEMLNSDRTNSIQYVFTNQVQLSDNPNSIFLATANFP